MNLNLAPIVLFVYNRLEHARKTLQAINNGWDSTGRHKDNYDVFPIDNWGVDYSIKKHQKI